MLELIPLGITLGTLAGYGIVLYRLRRRGVHWPVTRAAAARRGRARGHARAARRGWAAARMPRPAASQGPRQSRRSRLTYLDPRWPHGRGLTV